MSYHGTQNLVDKLIEDFDMEVQLMADELKSECLNDLVMLLRVVLNL